jgi:alpha-D-xyloside xylohydrolase
MERHEQGIRVRLNGGTLDLSWYGMDILRCRFWREREPALESLYLTAHPSAPADWRAEADAAGNVTVCSARLTACVDRAAETVRYTTPDGRELLAERPGTRAFPPRDYPRPEDRHGAGLTFRVDARHPLIGCGQLRDGRVDRRHSSALLVQTNHEAVLPVMLSPAGWALLWHNASATTFRHDADGMRWESNVADGVDYFVGHAEGERLVAVLHRLTGRPPLPPRWALGYFQSKERYTTAAEALAVAQEFRRRGLPLDCLVQDWAYWGRWADTPKWSCMRHDPAVYGDLPDLVRQLHEREHARLLISIWPAIGVGSDLERELTALGATFDPAPGHWQGDGKVKIYDAFNPAARAVYWRHAREGLWRHGVDSWWMDATEPELVNSFDGADQRAAADALPDVAAGSWARCLNGYVTPHVRGVYEGQRAASADKRVFILTRSGFLGTQAYGAAVWSGDIAATWRMLAEQVAAGISMTASGIPWWTTDCGAFFLGPPLGGHFAPDRSACADPAYRELYLRWFQFEAFSPLMRSHGTQAPREPWCFGEPGTEFYDGLVDMLRLRYRLLPYVESEAARLTAQGGTLLRPLALEFAEDPACAAVADQFLFGPALMACPVTRPFRHAPAETTEVVDYALLLNPSGRHRWMAVCDPVAPGAGAPTTQYPPNVDFAWPADRTPSGAVCETRFTPRADGPHTFALRLAGGARLTLDGVPLIEDWAGEPNRERRATLNLAAGRAHDLRVEYRRGAEAGPGRLRLGLIEPGRPELTWPLPAPETRDARLPPGAWWDFWTGERLEGGRTVARPAPLRRLPVLARAGALVPLGPHRQWTDEKPADPLELRVYPGADGAFTLYEDAGDGYAYERGECARIPLRWDDARQRLTLGAREGRFPGMLAQRTFHVVVVRPGHGVGIEPTPQPDRVVRYDGKSHDA